MKKLLIILLLCICMPAFSIHQTKALKKIKKDDGLKSDTIKGAIILPLALVAGYYAKKKFNDSVTSRQELLQDPRFTHYINPKGEVHVRSMPEDVRQQFEARHNELGINGATLKSLISGLICCGTGIVATIYAYKVIYKSIKHATSSNEDDAQASEATTA